MDLQVIGSDTILKLCYEKILIQIQRQDNFEIQKFVIKVPMFYTFLLRIST